MTRERRRFRAVTLALLPALALVVVLPPGASSQGTLSALQTDVDQIARAAHASVVTVYAENTVNSVRRRSQVRQRLRTRVGSGVAVEEFVIVTTASVVVGAERLWVRTTNGLRAEAQLAGLDPVNNVALLRVAEIRLPELKLSTGRPPRVGEWVMAVGTSPYEAQVTHSVGNIAYRHEEPRRSLLQLTNTVYPGYSGGAVLNARGELIGIVQGEFGPSSMPRGGYDSDPAPAGMSFVLPVDVLRPIYEGLRAEGRLHYGYLGVSTRDASVESDTEKGLRVPIGAEVEGVQPGGPAERAGLLPGDLIVGFDRERVEYGDQLARWVAATRPGTAVELVWVREEIQHTGKAALSESPEALPSWALAQLQPARDGQGAARIAELERQIQRLNRELDLLKTESTPR